MTSIVSKRVRTEDRVNVAHSLFGIHFPLMIESYIYHMASLIAKDYNGGYWEFHQLDNDGFYMASESDKPFRVVCENDFEGDLSADALGITVCLYAYSQLSFSDGEIARKCARHYHLLRDYAFEHPEVESILRAID